MTLKLFAAKITPTNAHLITLSDEKSGALKNSGCFLVFAFFFSLSIPQCLNI